MCNIVVFIIQIANFFINYFYRLQSFYHNSILVFIKQACHANPGSDKNEQDQVYIFQYIYFESFQIHLQVIMYHFERTSHDTHLDFLFQTFFTRF